MAFDWFYEPNVLITLPLFVGGFIVVSCAIVLALRPMIGRLVDDPKDWDRALAHVISTFGVFFGILLALVAVSVYENFAYTRDTTIEEAAQVGALYRATAGIDPAVGDPMRASLEEYMRTVIDEDFPAQQRGELPTASERQVNELEALVHESDAETRDQQVELTQVLATFDAFVESRRARIDATAIALPPLLWVVIWVGAAVNAVLIAFIAVKSRRLHLLVAGLLALFIGLVIFVTADMDHPYAGAIAVDPGAFERVLEQVIESPQ
ncbi:bestrophin-like domain [Agromyces soli]